MKFAASALLALGTTISRPEGANGISAHAFVMPKMPSRTKRKHMFDLRDDHFATLLEAANEGQLEKQQREWLEEKDDVRTGIKRNNGRWGVSQGVK